MKIEYSKSASCTKFGELPDRTKFIANLNAYIKFGDFFMDSNKVNAFNLDDEEFYYIPDDTMVTIPKAMKMVVELY